MFFHTWWTIKPTIVNDLLQNLLNHSFLLCQKIIQKYNNNAVFAGIKNIYGPRFFIDGPPVLFMPETKKNIFMKYIYGPLNFIYARRKGVKCATMPSK